MKLGSLEAPCRHTNKLVEKSILALYKKLSNISVNRTFVEFRNLFALVNHGIGITTFFVVRVSSAIPNHSLVNFSVAVIKGP